ncbi:PAS domain S-box protein [Horticoccus sp. 23ND18S-11]|uniref:PAS domain S-box protein n=1 Tax=Horticoccus sp. 23ND18S-11 TaxID=3391832 RepID=UPI0039C9A57B
MTTAPADDAASLAGQAAAEPKADTAAPFRDSRRQLELISENFPEGALYQYVISGSGRHLLTYLGRGFERIFGEQPAELPTDASWLTMRINPTDAAGLAEARERSRQELKPFTHEVRIQNSTGQERWVSFRSQPRAVADGTVVWDGAILDVTDRRRADEAVRRQADFLAALNQTTLELLGRRNVGELLQALVARASVLLKSPHAEISLLEQGDLVLRAYSRDRYFPGGDRVRRGEPAISWRAVETRLPVVVDRVSAHPESRDFQRAPGVHTAAVFPIVRAHECVGVLGVAREQPGYPFTSEDLREGMLLAQMAALVLHNAAIHEDAVRESEVRNAALRESEARYRGVFDQSPIVIGLLTMPECRIVELNAAGIAAFGYGREEVIGKSTLELGLWVDPNLRDRYLQRLRAEGTITGFEAEMRRRNGEIFTALHSGCLITLGGESFSVSSVQDITARKHSEAARDRSLALMRATLESTADAILVVNAEGRIETYNLNFAEMWGVAIADAGVHEKEDEVLRTILSQLVAPELFLASVRDLYARSEDEVFDVLHCKDGRVFERYSRPQLVASEPAGRVWSFRDITEQRRAEAALRQSEERFRLLADVSPAGIFSSDTSGRTVFVSRRWCEIAGVTLEQAMGDGWQQALHPQDRERVTKGWAEAVRNGESSTAEFRFLRPDGTITWLVGQSRAQLHADGSVAGYVGTITDVTKLKRAEEERTHLEAQARQSHKMESLGTLAGGIAHDFNNILTGTFGFVDLARLELEPGHPAHAWLDQISSSSQRARDLVRQILTFSRKSETERMAQRLHPVVGEALRLLRSTLPPMVELKPTIDETTPSVLADSTQIHQVVLNLCTNAWHAMPNGGEIAVTLDAVTLTPDDAASNPDLKPGRWVRLTIADQGNGMDAATLEHIFEPFFTTKGTGIGTGLGLAVVHGIVQSHEGLITVRSTVGEGSTFELYFPTAPEDVAPAEPAPIEIPFGRGEHILVVDDDNVCGFAVEKIIESLGYRATRHTEPEAALAQFTASPGTFDLVVSDLAMPGMDGAELIGHLSRIRPDIPIIVITGYIETARQRLLEKSPARVVLRKPVLRDELARAIAQHLRSAT